MHQTILLLTVTSLLTLSSSVNSAVYDPLEQRSDAIDHSSLLGNELGSSPSILESLQQSKVDDTKTNYLDVLELVKQNKLKEAREKVSNFLKKYPENATYYNLQALLETLDKNIPAATQNYQKAIQLNPKDMLAHLGLAKITLDAGELDKSKEFADQALAINEKNVNAYLVLADIAYKQKNNAEVEKILLLAHSKVKGNIQAEIEVVTNLGKFYTIEKKYDKILVLAENLTKDYPDNTQALSLFAGAQVVNNKKDLAEKTLRQLISLDKNDITHRLFLVRLLNEQASKEKEIMALLDEASTIAPKNPQVIAFKTAYLVKLKRYSEAHEFADKAEVLFPKLAISKILKGDVFLAERKLDNAIDYYQQAYQIQPSNQVLFTLVDLLTVQKKLPDALTLLKKELAKNPKNNALHFKLGTIYQQQNDYAQAETHYQAILETQPDNVLALNNLAWVYLQQSNPKAIALAEKAFSTSPNSADIADTYGTVLIKNGKTAEGLSVLEKAVKMAPNVNAIQFHLAEAYAANDNKKKAIELLEVVTKSEQNFDEKNAAVSLLEKLKAN